MSKLKVVLSDLRFPDAEIETEILVRGGGFDLIVGHCSTEEELLALCADADGVLLNLAPMTARVVEGLPSCRVISRYGVGCDNVDLGACRSRGIAVANVPDYCEEDVSDLALALLLSCARRVALKDRLIRAGQWNINAPGMVRLQGKTAVLVGFGRIARALLRKLSGFGLAEILVVDPFVSEEEIAACGARKAELEEAVARADFVSLHLPVTERTRGIISRPVLAKMKPTAFLINTARGALVDEPALLDALKTGRLAGAGLDTFCTEPLAKDSPFRTLDQCVLTDHSGFNTQEAVAELREKAAKNVLDVLQGRPLKYPVR